MNINSLKNIIIIWFAWICAIFIFQNIIICRFNLEKPDRLFKWTEEQTSKLDALKEPILNDPFLNTHVSWDSKYYLSIAINGYDDRNIRTVSSNKETITKQISLNYGFFPLYPLLICLLSFPLLIFGSPETSFHTLVLIMAE